MKLAIAHDYITQRGGAEKVVLAMASAFPSVPIYTLLYEPESTYSEFGKFDVRPSLLDKSRFFRNNHRAALPILPIFASSVTIDADYVICSSSGWSHGFRTRGKKLVYCYSPARWLYMPEQYLGNNSSKLAEVGLRLTSWYLKKWDKFWARRADRYLAISTEVQGRIRRNYNIDSKVVPSPHSVDEKGPLVPPAGLDGLEEDEFYLCICRLLPYKNVDKVIEAFRGTGRSLVVVGAGPQEESLTKNLPPNVVLLKHLSDAEIRWLYSAAKGVVSASYEDFGLTPIEAATYGKPSVVLRWGGFLDTIVEGKTGVFFDDPDPKLIEEAVEVCEATDWNAAFLKKHSENFSVENYVNSIKSELLKLGWRDE